jgi:hypothetical protein
MVVPVLLPVRVPLRGWRSVGAVKTVLIYGWPWVRGTAALQAATDHGCRDPSTEQRIQRLYQVLEPLEGSRPDCQIIQDIANRLGANWHITNDRQY